MGATIWETAESEPPFADVQDPRQIDDRWPSLKQPEIYSRSFHDFLRLCSEPSSSRPDPSALLNVRLSSPFEENTLLNSYIFRHRSFAMPAGALSMSNCFHNAELSKRACSSRRMPTHRNLYIHYIPGRLSYSPISPIFLYSTYIPCCTFHGLFQSLGLFHDKITFIFCTLCKKCSCFCDVACTAMSECWNSRIRSLPCNFTPCDRHKTSEHAKAKVRRRTSSERVCISRLRLMDFSKVSSDTAPVIASKQCGKAVLLSVVANRMQVGSCSTIAGTICLSLSSRQKSDDKH